MMQDTLFAFIGVFLIALFMIVAFCMMSPSGRKFFLKIKPKGTMFLKEQLYLDHKRKICIVENEGKEYLLFCGDKSDFLVDVKAKKSPLIDESSSL